MRDIERIEVVLDALRSRWLDAPDMRLGQLLVNVAAALDPDAPPMPELFYLEDDDLLAALNDDSSAQPSPTGPSAGRS